MKKIKLFVTGLASMAVLSSCAVKCDYAKFHEKAAEAVLKERNYDKKVLKGKIGDTELEVKYTFKNNEWKIDEDSTALGILASAVAALAGNASVVIDMKDTKYYAGSSFKVVTESYTETFNKFGDLTSYKGKLTLLDANIKIRYSR